MGVTLERVQNKFACIIGELCSEPDILSQFAIWVDLRIAEYKSKGYISLDCSGENPNPTWLRGFRPPPSNCSSRERTQEIHDIPRLDQRHRSGSHQKVEISWDKQTSPVVVSDRLSPEMVMIKQENADVQEVHPVGVIHTNASRKRTVTGGDSRLFPSPSSSNKIRRTDPYGTSVDRLSGAVLEPVHESLMSIIGGGDAEDRGGDNNSTIPTCTYTDSTASGHADNAQNNSSVHLPSTSSDVMPSTTRGDNSASSHVSTGDDGTYKLVSRTDSLDSCTLFVRETDIMTNTSSDHNRKPQHILGSVNHDTKTVVDHKGPSLREDTLPHGSSSLPYKVTEDGEGRGRVTQYEHSDRVRKDMVHKCSNKFLPFHPDEYVKIGDDTEPLLLIPKERYIIARKKNSPSLFIKKLIDEFFTTEELVFSNEFGNGSLVLKDGTIMRMRRLDPRKIKAIKETMEKEFPGQRNNASKFLSEKARKMRYCYRQRHNI
ncbi:uncharacterized protein LOC135463668 isoform X2 [Liolophura sinensis]|uniref:uncharacterized protein LOC135463668 isoform X2 n=1 Tax=Liolophura sinensis TaxID=3198878 RepID=UPI00315929EB